MLIDNPVNSNNVLLHKIYKKNGNKSEPTIGQDFDNKSVKTNRERNAKPTQDTVITDGVKKRILPRGINPKTASFEKLKNILNNPPKLNKTIPATDNEKPTEVFIIRVPVEILEIIQALALLCQYRNTSSKSGSGKNNTTPALDNSVSVPYCDELKKQDAQKLESEKIQKQDEINQAWHEKNRAENTDDLLKGLQIHNLYKMRKQDKRFNRYNAAQKLADIELGWAEHNAEKAQPQKSAKIIKLNYDLENGVFTGSVNPETGYQFTRNVSPVEMMRARCAMAR